jgi:hypothetical protein
MDDPVRARREGRRRRRLPQPQPSEADDERPAESDHEKQEAGRAELAELVQLDRVRAGRGLGAPSRDEVRRAEPAGADAGQWVVAKLVERDAPEVVAVRAEAEKMGLRPVAARQVLERGPLVGGVAARVVDRREERGDRPDRRSDHERGDDHLRDPPRALGHVDPPVEQRIDGAGDNRRRDKPEERERAVPGRVGEPGPRVVGRRQGPELRTDERSGDRGGDEQPQPPRADREHHDGRGREPDASALALRQQPARQRRGPGPEREPPQEAGEPPLRGQHERGPQPDEEDRGVPVRVGHRPGEPPVADEVRRGARPVAHRDRCRQRKPAAERGDPGRDQEALRAPAHRQQRDREGGGVEERQQRVVSRERGQRRPGGRDRLPDREQQQGREAGECGPWRHGRGPGRQHKREEQRREDRVEQPVAGLDAARFRPGEDGRGGDQRERGKRPGHSSVLEK